MRKTILLLSTMLLISVYAQAQRGQGQRGQRLEPKEQAERQTDALQEELGLSDEQYEKTYDVLLAAAEERRTKIQEVMAGGDRSGIREAIAEIQEEADKELKEIFTAQQWTAYEKWKENRPQRGRRGGGQ